MKKFSIGGIVVSLVITVSLVLALITVIGFLWKRLPEWTEGGKKIAGEAMKKAGEVLPGVKEMAKEIIPGDEIPAIDVGGEDIEPVPRYTGMIRVSYAMADHKRTVIYKGRVEFRAVSDFYQKEMKALGFKKKLLIASPKEEVYEYRKGKQRLEFRFKEVSTIRSKITELTIKEL